MKLSMFACLGLTLLMSCLGCGGGGHDIAEVSGTVTFDDKPLSNATVFFMPMSQGTQDAGPSSTGKTDQKGRFTLTTADERKGAVVGKHRVMITTVEDRSGSGEGVDADNVYAEDNVEKLPARYNSASTLEFEVPSEGTDSANFDLISK